MRSNGIIIGHLILIFTFIFCAGFEKISAQSRELRGLKTVQMNASATPIAMAEVEGILVLANLVQVELYLNNRIIGQYNYRDLLDEAGVGRFDTLYIFTDPDAQKIFIVQPTYGIGQINYTGVKSLNDDSLTKRIVTGDWSEVELKENLDTSSIYYNLFLDLVKSKTLAEKDQLCRVYKKEVWIAPKNSRKIVYKGNDGNDCEFELKTQIRDIAKDNYLSAQSKKLVFIAATADNALVQIEIDPITCKENVSKLHCQLSKGFQLKHVRSVYYLKSFKSVLIGSIGEGVFLWSHLRDQVFTPIRASEFETNDNLKADNKRNHIWSICVLNDSLYLAGNDIGNIDYINSRTHKAKRIKFGLDKKAQIMSIVKHPSKNILWIGLRYSSGKSEIQRVEYKIKDDSFRYITTSSRTKLNFDDCGKLHVLSYLDNQLWVGTDKGLFEVLGDTVSYTNSARIPIRFIGKDNRPGEEGFFFGGKNGSQIYKRLPSGEFKTIKLISKQNDWTETKSIAGITWTGVDNIFTLETRDVAIYICEMKKDSLVILPDQLPTKGLIAYFDDQGSAPILTIYGALVSKGDTTAWLSTNFGLLELDLNTYEFYRYSNKATGLPSPENNTLAFAMLNDSISLWGTLDGVVQVNMAAAKRARKEMAAHQQAAQIWRQVPMQEDGGNIDAYKQTNYRYEKVGDQTIEDFYDSQTSYWIVMPDYFLLNEKYLSLRDGDEQTQKIYSGVIVDFKTLFGKEPKIKIYRKEKKIKLSQSSFKIINKVSSNDVFVYIIISIILIIAYSAIVLVRLRSAKNKALEAKKDADLEKNKALEAKKDADLEKNKALEAKKDADLEKNKALEAKKDADLARANEAKSKKALEKQQEESKKRRMLFDRLGFKLEKAKGYQDIQGAFLGIEENEMETVLNATKISLYQFHKNTNTLQLIAHRDAAHLAHEDNSRYQNFSHISFQLDRSTNNHPVVYLWNNRRKISELIANNSAEDFYQQNNLIRQEPKIGGKANSFIFLIAGPNPVSEKDDSVPFGVIAIQNENKDAYIDKDIQAQYIFLMNMIGRLAYFKVEEIERKLESRIFESRGLLYKNRLEAHFLGDLITNPKRIIESNGILLSDDIRLELKRFSDQTKKLFKKIFATGGIIALHDEINLCGVYINLKNKITHEQGKEVIFSFEILDFHKTIKIPSLILLNLVHNSYKALVSHQRLTIHDTTAMSEIKIITRTDEKNLQVIVEDNGPGFESGTLKDLESYQQSFENPKNGKTSLYLIIDLFQELEQIFGGGTSIEFFSNKKINKTEVTISIPKNTVDQYSTLLVHSL